MELSTPHLFPRQLELSSCVASTFLHFSRCTCLQVCNRKQRGKTKNKQHAGHVEVVKLLLAAILKLREAPVQIEEKFSLGYGGVTMGEHV